MTETLINRISSDRLMDDLWQLVTIPSPTGRERQAAFIFADLLARCGARVDMDESIHDSPTVLGNLNGNRPGPTLILAGHIDHIDIPHDPPRREDGRIIARGAADMKNGLAGILEIVRLLAQTDHNFPGRLLIAVYGLHEAPTGHAEGLCKLLEAGAIRADAALVFEGPHDRCAVMANGMSIWNLNVRHRRGTCHELSAEPDRKDLLAAVMRLVKMLHDKNAQLREQQNPFPLLPHESLFIGRLHCGDFYNRVPDLAALQGTRRWHPDKTFEQIQTDMQRLLDAAGLTDPFAYTLDWNFVGDSYQIDPAEPLVRAMCSAYEALHNRPLPVRGHSSVTDTFRFVRKARIPAVLCGFGTETGHADLEFAERDRMLASCRLALLTVQNFLNHNPDSKGSSS